MLHWCRMNCSIQNGCILACLHAVATCTAGACSKPHSLGQSCPNSTCHNNPSGTAHTPLFTHCWVPGQFYPSRRAMPKGGKAGATRGGAPPPPGRPTGRDIGGPSQKREVPSAGPVHQGAADSGLSRARQAAQVGPQAAVRTPGANKNQKMKRSAPAPGRPAAQAAATGGGGSGGGGTLVTGLAFIR